MSADTSGGNGAWSSSIELESIVVKEFRRITFSKSEIRGAVERALAPSKENIPPGEVVSVNEIIEALWDGTPPGKPEQAVQMAVSRLRRFLDGDMGAPHPIQTVDGGYQIHLEPGQLDAELFEVPAHQ